MWNSGEEEGRFERGFILGQKLCTTSPTTGALAVASIQRGKEGGDPSDCISKDAAGLRHYGDKETKTEGRRVVVSLSSGSHLHHTL